MTIVFAKNSNSSFFCGKICKLAHIFKGRLNILYSTQSFWVYFIDFLHTIEGLFFFVYRYIVIEM